MLSYKYNQPETNNLLVNPHQWVYKYADYLYNYAVTRLNDEELARDLVQETFLAALEKLDKFKGNSSESTWITAILKNKIVDVYRKKSSGLIKIAGLTTAEHTQEDFFEADSGHWTSAHAPKLFGIEEQGSIINKEFNHILKHCMQKLPTLWLAVFTLKHMEEEATETICKELKVTSANFWVIIHRAKLNLRACLQKNWI